MFQTQPDNVIARNEMTKQSFVYIMTNYNKTTLYTGVTNNPKRRVYEHKINLLTDLPNVIILLFLFIMNVLITYGKLF